MQPISQFDEDDADVLGHRQHHLAEAFRLSLGFGLEIDLGQFADAIDEFSNILAKLPRHLLFGSGRVFDDIVQNSSGHALRIHPHLCQDARHRERMGNIRLAREPALIGVRHSAKTIGTINQCHLLSIHVVAEQRTQFIRLAPGIGHRAFIGNNSARSTHTLYPARYFKPPALPAAPHPLHQPRQHLPPRSGPASCVPPRSPAERPRWACRYPSPPEELPRWRFAAPASRRLAPTQSGWRHSLNNLLPSLAPCMFTPHHQKKFSYRNLAV